MSSRERRGTNKPYELAPRSREGGRPRGAGDVLQTRARRDTCARVHLSDRGSELVRFWSPCSPPSVRCGLLCASRDGWSPSVRGHPPPAFLPLQPVLSASASKRASLREGVAANGGWV